MARVRTPAGAYSVQSLRLRLAAVVCLQFEPTRRPLVFLAIVNTTFAHGGVSARDRAIAGPLHGARRPEAQPL